MSKLRVRLIAATGMAVVLLLCFSASALAVTQTYNGEPIKMVITDTARTCAVGEGLDGGDPVRLPVLQ